MAIGRKVYYELATGDVVLTTLEKPNINAVNTTKEQDFEIYDVLQARNPDTVGVIQLEFGQYQSEFQTAKSYKVNLETNELVFEYPVYNPPLTEQIERLKSENLSLKEENQELKEQQKELQTSLLETQNAINALLEV